MVTRTQRLGGPVDVIGDSTVTLWEPSAETRLVKNLRLSVNDYMGFTAFTLVYGVGAADALTNRYGIARINSPATIWSDDSWMVFEPGEQMFVRITQARVGVVAFGALLTNGGA